MTPAQAIPAAELNPGHSSAASLARYLTIADAVALLLAAIALVVLGLRAMLRLDLGWDAAWYHIPLAALRAGIPITYEIGSQVRDLYGGFPPLPELVQGVLWRVSGSVNATGIVNHLALVLFLYFCHRKIGARFWIVAIVSLTTPLVLIHAASSYVDLFSNALLAIGTSSLVAMYLFDRFEDRSLLLWGLFGLVAAAWSKYQLVPLIALFLITFLLIYGLRRAEPEYRRLFVLVVIAAFVAAAPYVKNLIVYHNPFWPVRLPIFGQFFPYTYDMRGLVLTERPPTLLYLNQFQLFFHSLLEINHPTHYSYRERWILDQSWAWEAYRMGGFWNVAVVTATAAVAVLGVLWDRRKGVILLGSMAALICFIAVLPHSNELRYYQFLPLTWAATIAMLLPRIRRSHPGVVLMVLAVLLSEFAYVSKVNRFYYRVERSTYVDAANRVGMSAWWGTLERGKAYCAVGFTPRAIMLTGPTMFEYHIIERTEASQCPTNSTVLKGP